MKESRGRKPDFVVRKERRKCVDDDSEARDSLDLHLQVQNIIHAVQDGQNEGSGCFRQRMLRGQRLGYAQ